MTEPETSERRLVDQLLRHHAGRAGAAGRRLSRAKASVNLVVTTQPRALIRVMQHPVMVLEVPGDGVCTGAGAELLAELEDQRDHTWVEGGR